MKHLYPILLLTLVLVSSCEESNNAKKSESLTEKKPEVATPVETPVAELNAEEAIDLADKLVLEIQRAENMILKLKIEDSLQVSATRLKELSDSCVLEIEKFNIEGFEDRLPTPMSSELLMSSGTLFESFREVAVTFGDYAEELVKSEDEWDDDFIGVIINLIDPAYQSMINAQEEFQIKHQEFLKSFGVEAEA